MTNNLLPQDQVFWYLKNKPLESLKKDIKTDVVVIGGGVAGLTAAQSFRERGLSVILLEKSYCGAGASGKSSGFITPDSELSLFDLTELYGEPAAHKLWEFVIGGVEIIKKNINNFKIQCDYRIEDTLVVANSASAFADDIKQEYQKRIKLKYTGQLYTQSELPGVLGSDKYYGGVRYSGTFGIQAYWYCQAMRDVLMQAGVQVYEETPALKINGHVIDTPQGRVTADYIVVCTDRFMPELGLLDSQVYHAQTFLLLSEPLAEKQIKQIFPDRPLMVWDSDLIYSYYRLAPDNRLMLGGASLWYTYAHNESHNNSSMAKKLQNYWRKKFPQIAINFEYIWPGLIGISKDIMPLAGLDAQKPYIYYIAAAAGLPWAAALGRYSCAQILDKNSELSSYFNPYRSFAVGSLTQKILGKALSFALSNGLRVIKWR